MKFTKPTLRRHLKIRKNFKQAKSSSLGRAPVFTPEQEREIRYYVLHLAKLFFGIIKTQLCQLVFKNAEKNNIRHNFNNKWLDRIGIEAF
jgi:hypothetical protein